jgi:hypothetical protein
MSDGFSNAGAGCLLLLAAICVFVVPILGLAALSDDSGRSDDSHNSSDEAPNATNATQEAESSWAFVIVPLACLSCVAVPIIAWHVIKPLA